SLLKTMLCAGPVGPVCKTSSGFGESGAAAGCWFANTADADSKVRSSIPSNILRNRELASKSEGFFGQFLPDMNLVIDYSRWNRPRLADLPGDIGRLLN